MAKKPKNEFIIDGIDVTKLTSEHFSYFLQATFDEELAAAIIIILNRAHEAQAAIEPISEDAGDAEADSSLEEPELNEGEAVEEVETTDIASDDDDAFEGEGDGGPEIEGEAIEIDESATDGGEAEGELGDGEPELNEGEAVEEEQEPAPAPAPKPKKADKPAKAAKPKKADKPAKKGGKKAKAKAEAAVEVEALTFSDVADKKMIAKTAKEFGNTKPAAVLKEFGIKMPKGIKATSPEAVAYAAGFIAAREVLSEVDVDELEAMAGRIGVEIKYGRTKSDEAKAAKALDTVLKQIAENSAA